MPPLRKERVNLPRSERIKDGRIFQVSKRCNSGVIYLRCSKQFCFGTAKKLRNGRIKTLKQHSKTCYADRNAQLKADFRGALKAALKRNFWKLKDLYETVVQMFPREIKRQVPYNEIVSSLKRWRRRFYPGCPETLELMAEQLEQPQNERLLEYDVGRLTTKKIRDAEGNIHLLIYDPQFIRTEFANVSHLFVDGTFQTTPRVRGVYQLVSILGVRYDHAIPFAHILMSKKTQCSYTAVFHAVKTHLINSESVAVVMTDFEQALRNACRQVFFNGIVTGCSVHYDRALLKKIKTLRLTSLVRENTVAKLFLKKIMALAYLPPTMIEAEYNELKNNLPEPLKRSLNDFLRYYERQWLRIVKPAGFSVFGLARRTNNVIESYNSVMAHTIGQHPSAWTFMGKLIKLTSNARDDVASLRLNKRISRHPRYATVFRRNELTNAWRKLEGRKITPEEFLNQAAALKGHISQMLMSVPDEPAEDEEEFEEGPEVVPFADDPDYDNQVFAENPDAAAQAQNDESDLDDAVLSSFTVSETEDENESDDGRLANNRQLNEETESDEELEMERENGLNDVNQGVQRLSSPLEPLQDANGEAGMEDLNDLDDVNPPEDRLPSPLELLQAMNEEDEFEAANYPNGNNYNDPERERSPSPFELQAANEEADLDHMAVGVIPVPLRLPNADESERTNNVTKSRKRNIRKKRRREFKKLNGDVPVRPYGHKRRAMKRKAQAPKCVVCFDKTVTQVFVPCGHHCCCLTCATILAQEEIKRCPKCRAKFQQFIEIFDEIV